MVRLHVKKGDDDLFLYDTTVEIPVPSLTVEIAKIHNGRLKIARMCAEIEYLADHGIQLPPNMVGILPEQLEELKLKDVFAETHSPSGGHIVKPDELLKRNGLAPNEKMAELLKTTVAEAKNAVHKNRIKDNLVCTLELVKEQFQKLKGAVMIVYPMGLPLHDPLHVELTVMEASDLSAGFGSYRDVIEPEKATLWWAGKELKEGTILKDYLGGNEKTKTVVKLAAKGAGMPGREPTFTEEQKKAMMAQAFKRQQEVEKLMEDDDDHYLNSPWADNLALKRCFQGIKDISFRPS